MMTLSPESKSGLLTYEDYMAEPEMIARYDILDGERLFMAQPTDQHQTLVLIIGMLLRQYQLRSGNCQAFIAPCDVLITRNPLRTRQPDVMLISNERNAGREAQNASPRSPAPELVVEILSPSETPSIRSGKIQDYCRVNVQECWTVTPSAGTIELLRLTPEGAEPVALYSRGQTLRSIAFPDLTVALDDIF